jgi:MFS family permease
MREGLLLLHRPDVARLVTAYLISFTGTAMAPIAMAFGVLEMTGSTRDAAVVLAAPTAASIAVLLFGGVLADRTSRQRLIVFADLLSMVAQLAIAGLFFSGTATVPVLTALMVVNGAANALNIPAATGLITQVVDRDELQSLNALMRPMRQAPAERASVFEDLRLGWREFTSHTWLWVIVLQFSLLVAVMESVMALLGPAVARDHMQGARDWGFIAASFGVGTMLGGVVSMKVRPRFPMRFATICTFSFCFLPLALATPLAVGWVAAAGFLQGVAGQLFGVLWYTTLQQKIPSHLLSRVSAYDHLGSIALAPLGIVVAGFAYEAIGGQNTLWIASAASVLATVATLTVRDVRAMTNSD